VHQLCLHIPPAGLGFLGQVLKHNKKHGSKTSKLCIYCCGQLLPALARNTHRSRLVLVSPISTLSVRS
jgi:hypothetical protein